MSAPGPHLACAQQQSLVAPCLTPPSALQEHASSPVRRRRKQRGFTLLELMIAISLLVFLTMLMTQIIGGTTRGADLVNESMRAPKIANSVFQQIFKDFRYIYYGGLTGEAGFRGSENSIAGRDADKVSFITARRTRTVGVESDGRIREDDRPSPLTEVGYACRVNDVNSDWLEIWRREDFFVDANPAEGGQYSLLYDRVQRFRLRYYPIPEEARVKEGLPSWDSSQKGGLPYAILLRLDFDVLDDEEIKNRGKSRDQEYETIYRILLLRGGYSVRWGDGDQAAGDNGNSGGT